MLNSCFQTSCLDTESKQFTTVDAREYLRYRPHNTGYLQRRKKMKQSLLGRTFARWIVKGLLVLLLLAALVAGLAYSHSYRAWTRRGSRRL